MSGICVLLATYNGEKFIDEQLASLFSQTVLPNKIFISDDNSTDSTSSLVESWQKQYPNIIELHGNISGWHGHVGNFAYLCELAKKSQCEYFLFCDQDDVWYPNKIEELLRKCHSIEQISKIADKTRAVLVHSDLEIVDEQLNTRALSFFKDQKLPDSNLHSMPKLLIQNVVTGCTTLFNRALLEAATPLPKEVIVHDWWFAIVADLEGVTAFVDSPLVKYRQHDNNSIGAVKNENRIQLYIKAFKHLKLSFLQAKTLNKLYGDSKVNEIRDFVSFYKQPFGKQKALVQRLVNNPNCKIEKSLLYFALFLCSMYRIR